MQPSEPMSDVTRDELERRLGEEGLVLLDVRSAGEFSGEQGYPCDARQGHLPGRVATSICRTFSLRVTPPRCGRSSGLPRAPR